MQAPITIAFPIPTTSHGQQWKSVAQCHLIRTFFKSFMSTFSPEYKYKFYFGIDEDDPFYSQASHREQIKTYMSFFSQISVEFIVMKDVPKGHLTKMWNILCKKAYDDGCDYFYFCGDDIEFTKQGWINKAVQLLREHGDIGFTGPTNRNGNQDIITQTFVSRKHFDIFGYAYPEEIKNWYCDDWVNLVYSPRYVYRMDEYHCYNRGGTERYSIVEAREICYRLAIDDRKKIEAYLANRS